MIQRDYFATDWQHAAYQNPRRKPLNLPKFRLKAVFNKEVAAYASEADERPNRVMFHVTSCQPFE